MKIEVSNSRLKQRRLFLLRNFVKTLFILFVFTLTNCLYGQEYVWNQYSNIDASNYGNRLTHVAEKNGNVYISGLGGLFKFDQDQKIGIRLESFPQGLGILNLFKSESEKIWLNGTTWFGYLDEADKFILQNDKISGFPQGQILGMRSGVSPDELWFSIQNIGIVKVVGNNYSIIDLSTFDLGEMSLRNLYVDYKGDLWFTNVEGAIVHYDHTQAYVFATLGSGEEITLGVNSICGSEFGGLWVAHTEMGLLKVVGNEVNQVAPRYVQNQLSFVGSISIIKQVNGQLIGLSKGLGLALFKDGTWHENYLSSETHLKYIMMHDIIYFNKKYFITSQGDGLFEIVMNDDSPSSTVKSDDENLTDKIIGFPNPNRANGVLYISSEGSALNGVIRIYGVDGRLCHAVKPSFQGELIYINLPSLSPGMYIVKFQTTSGFEAIKLIIK